MTHQTNFKPLWIVSLLIVIVAFSLQGQTTAAVRASIGKALSPEDSTKVLIYAHPNTNLNNILIENINVCISVPDQGLDNPEVFVFQNYVSSLDWTPLASNPEVIDGRAYYTFIGNDNESNTRVSWSASMDNPIVELSFRFGVGRSYVQLNDLTKGGVGFGGGGSAQAFWYVQANALGDITDYDFKFYQSPYSKIPLNGGAGAPSVVETGEAVALPVVNPSLTNAEWLLFPNPTTGYMQLLAGVAQPARLAILDQNGRMLWEEAVVLTPASLMPINPGSLMPPGTYIFEARGLEGRRLFSDRFVVVRF